MTHGVMQLNVKLKTEAPALASHKGKVTVQGSNANVSHTINEDERAEFTNHINSVRPLRSRSLTSLELQSRSSRTTRMLVPVFLSPQIRCNSSMSVVMA